MASLPISWVERIFLHCQCFYGNRFTDMWRGTDIDAVKAMWAEKLGGFIDRPEAIKLALDALDDKTFPPTLPEFLHLCRESARRIGPKELALEHKISYDDMRRNKERIHDLVAKFAAKSMEAA